MVAVTSHAQYNAAASGRARWSLASAVATVTAVIETIAAATTVRTVASDARALMAGRAPVQSPTSAQGACADEPEESLMTTLASTKPGRHRAGKPELSHSALAGPPKASRRRSSHTILPAGENVS